MYNVIEMREELENAVAVAEESVRRKFFEAFNEIYLNSVVAPDFPPNGSRITKHIVKNLEDIEGIITGAGFYVIFTSYNLSENLCSLSSDELKAIYRGESATVKKRVQSHIFNKQYKSDYESRKSNE
ncbi:MAG: hypothetical protein HOP34_09050 [Methylococcaceae bacterium]|nr:hypothetical protein [Methylococcaceae bacterium]